MEPDGSGSFIVLPILLLLSAAFSASETAFFSLNTLRLERLANEGDKRAEKILKLLSKPADLIATILIGNEMVNICIASVSTIVFVKLLGAGLGATVAVPATVAILLVFGEVVPKTFAIRFNERYAFFILNFIATVKVLFTPLRHILVGFAELTLKPFGLELYGKPKTLTDEEFLILVSEGAREGTIAKEEKELIEKALNLGETDVKDIMTPRHRVFAIHEQTPAKDAVEFLKKGKRIFSRIPLHRGSIDEITGILYTRNLVLLKLKGGNLGVPVKELANPPWFVTEFLTVDRLLEEMQRSKRHLAVVVDEYGSTAGVVTLEDVINAIVSDRKTPVETQVLPGDIPIEDVKKVFGFKGKVVEEVDTLAGLVMAISGKVPKVGESVELEGYRLTVKAMEGNRITMVKVERKR